MRFVRIKSAEQQGQLMQHRTRDVPTFGPRMVCTRCGIIGADARPNWPEKAQ
jgi:hypothetical protein